MLQPLSEKFEKRITDNMKIKQKLAVLVGLIFMAKAVSAQSDNVENINFWSDLPDNQLAQYLVDNMSDEELLSQILMFGWAGATPSDLLNAWVTDRGLGSVKVFGWNTEDIKNVAKSVKQLQNEALSRRFQIPLFVATDQEGGWIRHVKGETSDTPGNMAIGASGYPEDAYLSGYYINKEIWALGINMNFAPTVDLYTNLDSSVIGPRSFGADPDNAGILGVAFAKGSLDAGVIPTAKHFPGHGDTSLDSHGRLPEIEADMETLMNRELVPFIDLINSGIPAIMSAHLSFPSIEPDGTPASLSKKWLTDILRGQLGYEGLIITDDMMMNGATMFAGSFQKAVTMAIEAGNDIVISSTTSNLYDNMWVKNLDYMHSREGFKDRVKDACYRVLLAKLKYFKGDNAAPLFPDENTIYDYIPNKDGQAFFTEQACRSITVVRGKDKLPYKPEEGEKILIVGPFNALYNEGRKRYPDCTTFHISYSLNSDESNLDEWNGVNLVWTARKYDTIIINVYDNHSANIAKRLRNMGKKVIILSILTPVPILNDSFDFADIILCGYSYSYYSFDALFGALNGEFVPEGTLPLRRQQ